MTSGSASLTRGLPMAYRWPITVAIGAAVVALSAQFAVPLPFTPVPLSLQGLAVLLVGGLIGAAAGAGAMGVYLLAGAFGLPVFANGGAGLARLFGPTGGYLLAFPLAAAIVGAVARRGNLPRSLAGALLGMLTIHVGGVAQLALLTGSLEGAVTAGSAPFLLVDSLKIVIVGLVLWRAHDAFRPRA